MVFWLYRTYAMSETYIKTFQFKDFSCTDKIQQLGKIVKPLLVKLTTVFIGEKQEQFIEINIFLN